MTIAPYSYCASPAKQRLTTPNFRSYTRGQNRKVRVRVLNVRRRPEPRLEATQVFSEAVASAPEHRQILADSSWRRDRTAASQASRNFCTVLFAESGNQDAARSRGPCGLQGRWFSRFRCARLRGHTCGTDADTSFRSHWNVRCAPYSLRRLLALRTKHGRFQSPAPAFQRARHSRCPCAGERFSEWDGNALC